MSLKCQFGQPVRGGGRELKPQLLDLSESDFVKKNLRDIARINHWFGGHRALFRLLRESPTRKRPVLRIGCGRRVGRHGEMHSQAFSKCYLA